MNMPAATMRLRGLPEIETWTSAQIMMLMFIGCRVTAKTPRGGGTAIRPAPGWGKAGLRISEPARRIEATSISAEAIGHHQSGATQAGTPSGVARKAKIVHPRVTRA